MQEYKRKILLAGFSERKRRMPSWLRKRWRRNSGIVASLDIETIDRKPILVAIYKENGTSVQLTGNEITRENILEALRDVSTLVVFNGRSFDLPIIRKSLGLDLDNLFYIHDLRYDCEKLGLHGGLKVAEKIFGLQRIYHYNCRTLRYLKLYNKEDAINTLEVWKRLPAWQSLARLEMVEGKCPYCGHVEKYVWKSYYKWIKCSRCKRKIYLDELMGYGTKKI